MMPPERRDRALMLVGRKSRDGLMMVADDAWRATMMCWESTYYVHWDVSGKCG